MQARSLAAVTTVGDDAQLVGLPQLGQRDPAIVAGLRGIHGNAVQGDLEHLAGDQVGIARAPRLGAAERDHRRRPECLPAAGQVNRDVVGADAQQPGPLVAVGPGDLRHDPPPQPVMLSVPGGWPKHFWR
jgi:hypothetical protein